VTSVSTRRTYLVIICLVVMLVLPVAGGPNERSTDAVTIRVVHVGARPARGSISWS